MRGEPLDGLGAGGLERVDAEENRRALVEGGDFRIPGGAEFRRPEFVEPIGDRLADGARLGGEIGLAGLHFIGLRPLKVHQSGIS